MNAKHSPGAWHFGGPSPISGYCVFNRPFGLGDIADVKTREDARLIAAAPDLLDALNSVREQAWPHLTVDVQKQLDAAIAKATGAAQ